MANLQVGVAGNGTVTVGAGASVHSPASNTLTLGTNNDERLRITSTGNLLVGADAVEDWDGSRDHRIQVTGNTYQTAGISILDTQNDDNPCELLLGKSRGTGNTIVGSADDVGQLRWAANDGAGFHSIAWIRASMDGTPGSDDLPSKLTFGTSADGGTTVTERLRIDSSGNVTKPTNFHILVARDGNQTGYNASNMGDVIIWNSVVTGDSSTGAADHFNTSTGLFTAPVTGLYYFHVSVNCNFDCEGGWINVNGSRPNYSAFYPNNTQSADGHLTYHITAGETVGIKWYDNGNTSTTINANTNHTWWRIVLLG